MRKKGRATALRLAQALPPPLEVDLFKFGRDLNTHAPVAYENRGGGGDGMAVAKKVEPPYFEDPSS